MKISTTQSILHSYWFLASIRASNEVSVILDNQLRYVAVSNGMCKLLNKERVDLEGNCMTDLYPEIVKFKNFENLQRALEGLEFVDTVPAITGEMFVIHYRPIYHDNKILAVHTESRKVQVPAPEDQQEQV